MVVICSSLSENIQEMRISNFVISLSAAAQAGRSIERI